MGLTGASSRLEHVSYAEAYGQQFDDMARRVPDLTRIRQMIGFQPGLALEPIIQSVIASLRQG